MFGKHTTDSAVTMSRCHKLTVRCHTTLPVHLDGEVVMRDVSELEVEMQAGRLEIIV
jgi:diacylglycerol kinase family enzyme